MLPNKIIWTLAEAIAPLPKSCPEQVITVPLRSAVALSINIIELNGKDLETFKMVRELTDIGAAITVTVVLSLWVLLPKIDLVSTVGWPGLVMLHSSKVSSFMIIDETLQLVLSGPPKHTYSTPAGSSST